MSYPLISEYIEAIKSAEDNFEKLSPLRPVLNGDGLPVMTSGNFAVVFKMRRKQGGKFYAVKCFTKDQKGRAEAYKVISKELENVNSPYLIHMRYYDKELFVDTSQTSETEFPVLLMDWVEGKTLDCYLREIIDDNYSLGMLAFHFSQLAQWLIPQPFAHGDIKPDNILVRDDGSLVLVDYDGMYVPAMKGQNARELGSPDFRHPSRIISQFDERIDDFSLITILMSLKAYVVNPTLYDMCDAYGRFLFSENDYTDLPNCGILKEVLPSIDIELNRLGGIFLIALSNGNLSQVSSTLLSLNRPNNLHPSVSTSLSIDDFDNVWKDDFGAIYSDDRKYLLKGVNVQSYNVEPGTQVIVDDAFNGCFSLVDISIPDSVTHIGDTVFYHCTTLKEICIPENVIHIGKNPFVGCLQLSQISCKTNNYVYVDGLLLSFDYKLLISCISKNKEVELPSYIEKIGDYAFSGCNVLKTITMSETVKTIGESAFNQCSQLVDIVFPISLISIETYAFSKCKSLKTVTIPETVKYIEDRAFSWCDNLSVVNLKGNVKISNNAFYKCKRMSKLIVPTSARESYLQKLPMLHDIIETI